MKIYDPSGDSTIPSTSKKRKFEEVEQQEAAEEPTTSGMKTKKPKKEPQVQGEQVMKGRRGGVEMFTTLKFDHVRFRRNA